MEDSVHVALCRAEDDALLADDGACESPESATGRDEEEVLLLLELCGEEPRIRIVAGVVLSGMGIDEGASLLAEVAFDALIGPDLRIEESLPVLVERDDVLRAGIDASAATGAFPFVRNPNHLFNFFATNLMNFSRFFFSTPKVQTEAATQRAATGARRRDCMVSF